MADYLFIQSQDPFTETRTIGQYELAARLAQAGNRVSVVLVQNGVSPARQGADCTTFDALADSPVTVLADEFALRQREIETSQLKKYVEVCALDVVVDAMLAGHKVIWN